MIFSAGVVEDPTEILVGALRYFSASFAPAGVNFNTYPQAIINVSLINSVNGKPVNDINDIPNLIEEDFNKITVNNVDGAFLGTAETLKEAVTSEAQQLIVFEDAPAVRAKLRSPILSIDGQVITSPEKLSDKLSKYKPGDIIKIESLDEKKVKILTEIELAEKNGNSYLGVGFYRGVDGFRSWFNIIQKIRDPLIYYEPTWNENIAQFIYDLLWWLIIINILVALFNMLPFALRWLLPQWEEKTARNLLEKLTKHKVVRSYPVLIEANGERVAQAEHTFIPQENGITVTTL